ncbi:hypothetical protein AB5J49_11970 [Streptomyces sp. R28]|uniref:NB-ARC domain-containing protein n=1 Tax=Streptomyces sp. R28 TaxID=3238628 RepID=A0AB39PSH8_9ACTN
MELRDARHAAPDDLPALVADVRAHVTRLDGPMTLAEPGVRHWLLGTPQPRPDFLGRLLELWQVHSALHAHAAPLVTGRAAAHAVQIRGMAGIGKTLLAQEYALRFEAAYPGGVCWVDGEAYEDSVRALGAGAGGLFAHFDAIDAPFLWIVDAAPADRLPARDIAAMSAPHPLGHTLFTLRSRAYDTLGTPVDLGPLDPPHARVGPGATRRSPTPSTAIPSRWDCWAVRSGPATTRARSTTGCTPGAAPSSTPSPTKTSPAPSYGTWTPRTPPTSCAAPPPSTRCPSPPTTRHTSSPPPTASPGSSPSAARPAASANCAPAAC